MHTSSPRDMFLVGFGRCAKALFLGLAWLGALTAHAQSAAPPMTLVQVSPHVYFVEGVSALGSPLNQNFISNAGFVVAPQGVVVIDALGSPALAQRLIDLIRGITDKPIAYVIVTHYHADHVYGLQAFRDQGAKIIAQEQGKLYLNSDTARLRLEVSREELAPWVDENTELLPADVWVVDDERVELAGWLFDLLKMGPAHTPDDLAVFVPQENVLFAGDLVFRGRIPFVGTADSEGWIKSLDRLLVVNPAVVVPGHGPYSTEVQKDLKMTRDYLQYLRDTMGPAARDLEDFDQTYQRTDWSAYEALPLFGMANRMNAYNVFLSIQNE
jgi:glyoxylase-like metal-dependent hydrolase (beta-lactamase superfamily II)